ncbi:MAG: APC family permease [Spirobacillus cienkowskii]|uniref:APC family permease n=1 Tax=Spirobacillus cienkowskii TaxID=495820 RepID=A0A369KRM5_9BACT|nr:MAG: APC family permease [Spirobacillus cienkowskii]
MHKNLFSPSYTYYMVSGTHYSLLKASQNMELKRNISKTSLLFLSIGSIIGSGWLFGSFYTAQTAGPAAILSWIIGGFCVGIIALTFAELSTMLPLSGGSTAFVTLSHGKMTGAIFAWITWLWTMVIAPIEVQAILQYASNYIPNLTEKINNNQVLTDKGLLFAALLLGIMSFINIVGVKIMTETTKLVVVWKLIVPLSVAILLLTTQIHPSNLTSSEFAPFGFTGVLSSIAIGGVSFSFFGFQTAIFVAGEAKNPQKSIPIALFGSIAACMLLYTLLQLGFILAIDPSAVAAGWDKIQFSGDSGPFAGIFLALGLGFMVKVLYVDAFISPLGTAVGYVAASSRILYSISLQNDAPKAFAKVNRFSIPWLAIIANYIIGLLLFLPFSGWQSMIAFLSSAIVLTLACGPLCLPIFRKNFASIERPFKLPFYNLISLFAFYICNLMLLWTGWNTLWKLIFAVFLGVIVFSFTHIFNKNNKNEILHLKSFIWLAVYLVFSGIISYLSTFGGGIGIISMELSFLVVAINSIIIFILSNKTSLNKSESNKIYNKLMQKHTKSKN